MKWIFEEVTLLITHYNRSESLIRLLNAFQSLEMSFYEVLVSDDFSSGKHMEALIELDKEGRIRLLKAERNGGLGNNQNKGHKAVNSPFVLYVQEDFVPKPAFPEKFQLSLELMREDDKLDCVRYYAYKKYPFKTPVRGGFSKMHFGLMKPGYKKFFQYSDHPHLRRKNFLEKFGLFKEGLHGEVTEYHMMMSALQNNFNGLLYDEIDGLFEQLNDIEPSSLYRSDWKEKRRFSNNIFILIPREIFRYVSFHSKLLFLNYKVDYKD